MRESPRTELIPHAPIPVGPTFPVGQVCLPYGEGGAGLAGFGEIFLQDEDLVTRWGVGGA